MATCQVLARSTGEYGLRTAVLMLPQLTLTVHETAVFPWQTSYIIMATLGRLEDVIEHLKGLSIESSVSVTIAARQGRQSTRLESRTQTEAAPNYRALDWLDSNFRLAIDRILRTIQLHIFSLFP